MASARAAFGTQYRAAGETLSRADRIARLARLARIMDAAFAIPGTKIRLGADSVLGLAPGVGDLIAKVASVYILYEAHQLGVPKHKLALMGGNVLVDLVFGSVPIAGDVFDIFWRANMRNLKIVRDHVEKPGR